jgi:hypothetical protein
VFDGFTQIVGLSRQFETAGAERHLLEMPAIALLQLPDKNAWVLFQLVDAKGGWQILR